MKKYKFIKCTALEDYKGWEIFKIIDSDPKLTWAVIMKEDKPVIEKNDEFEDIEELEEYAYVVYEKDDIVHGWTDSEKVLKDRIDQLIRNQKKIIERLNKDEM